MKATHALKKVLFLLPFLGMVMLVGCQPDDNKEPEVTPVTTPTAVNKTLLLQLVNAKRASGCNCGGTAFPATTPLTWNNVLETVALDHSLDMSKMGVMQHQGSDGSNVATRATRRGYSYSIIGENIAWNYPTEQSVIDGWINSPAHCENIMNHEFKEMGIARVGSYWTQVLGASH